MHSSHTGVTAAVSKENNTMANIKKIIATIALLGAFASPVFAESPQEIEGKVTAYRTTGAVVQMTVKNKAMLDDMTKGLTPLADNAMVVMHNGKFYLVLDHKMPNGKMLSEMLHDNTQ